MRFRCDRQEQALGIVVAALARPFSSLPSDYRQEALACMHRHLPPHPRICRPALFAYARACEFFNDFIRLRAALGSSASRSSPCCDNDPLRSLPALHAGALAHANQARQNNPQHVKWSLFTTSTPLPTGLTFGWRHCRVSVPLHTPHGARAAAAATGQPIWF